MPTLIFFAQPKSWQWALTDAGAAVSESAVARLTRGLVDVGASVADSVAPSPLTAGVNTYAWQWQRGIDGVWTNIAGATGPQYAPQVADLNFFLRCRITATNDGGSTDAYSNEIGPIGVPGGLWIPPRETEMWYGRLPWPESQVVFSSTAPVALSAESGEAGWHGTATSAERGAFAIARADGKFDPMLGERIRVSTPGGSVYLYVLDLQDMDYDLSLTRRAYLELAELGTDKLEVVVEKMT